MSSAKSVKDDDYTSLDFIQQVYLSSNSAYIIHHQDTIGEFGSKDPQYQRNQ